MCSYIHYQPDVDVGSSTHACTSAHAVTRGCASEESTEEGAENEAQPREGGRAVGRRGRSGVIERKVEVLDEAKKDRGEKKNRGRLGGRYGWTDRGRTGEERKAGEGWEGGMDGRMEGEEGRRRIARGRDKVEAGVPAGSRWLFWQYSSALGLSGRRSAEL